MTFRSPARHPVLTVLVVRPEDAPEGPEGRPPERLPEVVAGAVGRAVGVVGVAARRGVPADVRSSHRSQIADPLVPQRCQVVAETPPTGEQTMG